MSKYCVTEYDDPQPLDNGLILLYPNNQVISIFLYKIILTFDTLIFKRHIL